MQWMVYMVLNAIANSELGDMQLLLVAMLMNSVIFATVALLSLNWVSAPVSPFAADVVRNVFLCL